MQLPAITAGKRLVLPRPWGSADALQLAQWCGQRVREGRITALVCADPGDCTRLADELVFFDPSLQVAVFPDWETLPWDAFSPHDDLISERLVNLARALVGGVQGGLAMSCVITCMIFAAVSGSSVATTFAIGAFLIPAMVRYGYPVQ